MAPCFVSPSHAMDELIGGRSGCCWCSICSPCWLRCRAVRAACHRCRFGRLPRSRTPNRSRPRRSSPPIATALPLSSGPSSAAWLNCPAASAVATGPTRRRSAGRQPNSGPTPPMSVATRQFYGLKRPARRSGRLRRAVPPGRRPSLPDAIPLSARARRTTGAMPSPVPWPPCRGAAAGLRPNPGGPRMSVPSATAPLTE